jgi:predicted dehydrogenase
MRRTAGYGDAPATDDGAALTAAVVGTGTIARQHLACLNAMRGARVLAVCDRSPATAEAVAELFGIPAYFDDHLAMLESVRPDVVHVTTPPASHVAITRDALSAGAHVIVEKPLALAYDDVRALLGVADGVRRTLVEDHNYVFNPPVQKILALRASGELGDITHVEARITLDVPEDHPAARTLPGGVVGDFLTHLASLTHALIGPPVEVDTVWSKRDGCVTGFDDFQALVTGNHATAALSFSASSPPDGFWLRVHGTGMRATANLFEPRLSIERVRSGPRPLTPLVNGLAEAVAAVRGAGAGVVRKLSGGPGPYEGLWELVRRTYAGLAGGTALPVTHADVDDVNRLVHAMLAGRPSS